MVQLGNDYERIQLFQDLYGIQRPIDLQSNISSNNRSIPNRIEDIPNLKSILELNVIADVTNDDPFINRVPSLDPSTNNLPNKSKDDYILYKKTHIRNVSDTKSLSSNDNTPNSSPRKIFTNNFNIYSPSTITEEQHNRSSATKISTPVSQSLQQEQAQQQPLRTSKSEFLQKKKPSIPQLALSGLKRQTSFSNGGQSPQGNNNNNSPSAAFKKSPLQGFGVFSKSNNNNEKNNNPFIQDNSTTSINHSGTNDQSRDIPNSSGSFRSMSITSNTLKSLKSSFGSRKSSQKFDSTNSFNDIQYQPNSAGKASNSQVNSLNKSISDSNMGLGIKTRKSSTSLMAKRYMSGSSANLSYRHTSSASSTVTSKHHHGYSSQSHHSSRKPQVYPALLSRVATKFKSLVQVSDHKKNGLLYRDSFTGQQAVSVICSIIRTSDRNLALLLGRSLDAQNFFHDVVYEHRLRDSPNEIYEFTDNLRIIGSNTGRYDQMNPHEPLNLYSMGNNNVNTTTSNTNNLHYQPSMSSINTSRTITASTNENNDINLSQLSTKVIARNVNGVFTLLAECYSPTCTRDKLCYSISCPHRLEQQARLNLKPNGGLKRNISMNLDDDEEERQCWTSSVPEEIWKNLPKKEIKRQEAIFEVFNTEKKFIKSLEITRDTFMKTLAETNIIPSDIRKNFIKHVFAHINDIYSVNRRFFEALAERQRSQPIVRGIGDIILRFLPFFEPFISYVASRPYAKYLIETQRSVNPYFSRFDDDMMNSSLRHGIDSFLSQGVSRPGRYMLLVKEILKSTDAEKESRDYENLNKAMESLKAFMSKIDAASGAAQDRHDVKLLKQKILFKNEYVNLGLNDEKRKIKHEGILFRKEMAKTDNTMTGDIQFYLLDNLLLFLKAKSVNKWHQHKVFQRPIPLQLLFTAAGEEVPLLKRVVGATPDSSACVLISEYNHTTNQKNAITFVYYGAKQKYQVTLFAAQFAGLQTLLDKIKIEQQRIINETSMINIIKISDKFFDYNNKINSVVSSDGGRKLLIASNLGLYVSNIRRQPASATNKSQIFFSTPTQVIQRNNITQVGVLEEFKSILLLIDKKLYSCPLALLDVEGNATHYFKKHGKELINHVNFFAEGDCNGKRLVVTAHSHSIKYFEHEHPLLPKKSGANSDGTGISSGAVNPTTTTKKNLKKNITEVIFDSEPVSVSFLKANLCIGCKKGFQIVSIFRNQHEALLDSADTSLEFALKDTLKPMAIYRVGSMFLLCYTEFAFFVNNQGWRKKDSHIINWEGEPQKFAIWYPYILAFDSNFIEIRKIETGELVRCILGEKIRLLQTSSQEILYVYEDSRGYDTVASLDFWG